MAEPKPTREEKEFIRTFRRGPSATFGGPNPEELRMIQQFRGKQPGLTPDEELAKYLKQKTIAGPALDAKTRSAMAFWADNPETKRDEFLLHHPEGEIFQPPGYDYLLFRNHPREDFRKVDPGIVETTARGTLLRETGADIAEFVAGEGPSMLGEAAGLFAGRGKRIPGAGRFGTDLVRQAVGAVLGETGRQTAQTAVGTEQESFKAQATHALSRAPESIIGNTLGAAAGGVFNVARGRPMFNLDPNAAQARASARRLGIEEPMAFQQVKSPFIKRMAKQSAALASGIHDAVARQQDSLNLAVRALVDRPARKRLIREARALLPRFNQDIESLVGVEARHSVRRGASPRESGEALGQLVEQWWRSSGDSVNALYRVARSIETPDLSLDTALQAAAKLKRGVVGKGKTVSEQLKTDILDPSGKPISRTVPREQFVDIQQPHPQILEVIEKIERLDPSLPSPRPGEAFDDPVEVLRGLESDLADLVVYGAEGSRALNAQAAELKAAIRSVLDNPRNLNPEHAQAWNAARSAAHQRFQTREHVAVLDVIRVTRAGQDLPTEALRSLTAPGSQDRLIALARAGGNPVLEPVRDVFRADLMAGIRNGSGALKKYDEPTLKILIPDGTERAAWRETGRRFDELNRSGLPRALEQQTEIQGFIKQLIDTPETASIEALRSLMERAGGRDSPFGVSLRAAIHEEIWQRSTQTATAVPLTRVRKAKIIASKKVKETLGVFQERGLLKFLHPAEIKTWMDSRAYQRLVESSQADAGTSMEAASIVAKVRNAPMAALAEVIQLSGIGRLMTSRQARVFLGTQKWATEGAGPMDTRALKFLGSAALHLAMSSKTDRKQQKAWENFSSLKGQETLNLGLPGPGVSSLGPASPLRTPAQGVSQ